MIQTPITSNINIIKKRSMIQTSAILNNQAKKIQIDNENLDETLELSIRVYYCNSIQNKNQKFSYSIIYAKDRLGQKNNK